MPSLPTLVIGHDQSPNGETAFEAARRLALDLGAGLTLVHAFAPPRPYEGVAGAPRTRDQQASVVLDEQDQARTLTLAADQARAEGLEVETIAEEAHPATLILETAKRLGAPMIVVRTHGTRGLKRLVLGSTAEEIVRKSDRPVLVVPSKD